MTATRNYNSPLREDQMELTRQRILETAADMLAEGVVEVTVATVAERAKVSVRTAYRYFPTREALIDDLNVWISKQWGAPPLPASLDDVPGMAAQLIESFERNERYVRARRQTEIADALRKRRKAEQVRSIRKVLAKDAPQYDDRMQQKLAGLYLLLLGSEAWLALKDNIGLTTAEAIETVQWGVDAIATKIDSDRARKGRK